MTAVDICNHALARLGEVAITSLSEVSTAGRACNLVYELTRDAVLQSHRWNFATGRDILDASATEPVFGWAYAFDLPGDCLQALEVNGTEIGEGTPWVVEGNQVLTNEAGPYNLIYTRYTPDTTKFTPLFIDALVLRLASKLAVPIRSSSSNVGELEAEYRTITAPLARRLDANQGRVKKGLWPTRSRLWDARGGHC